MASISNKLKKKFSSNRKSKVISFADVQEEQLQVEEILHSIKTPDKLKDMDPLHAVHVTMQNLMSVFAEHVSAEPELDEYYKKIGKLEDVMLPGYPPISPITTSFFTLWTFYDFGFGNPKETMGTLLLKVAKPLGFPDDWILILKIQNNSHMGIYEHCGFDNSKIMLQDIITGNQFKCICPSGYSGNQGELWFVRLVKSPHSILDYVVAFTTPYVLQNHGKDEWLKFFARNRIKPNDSSLERKYKAFMKEGNSLGYWHNYILDAYNGCKQDVIFLTGIPGRKETLPHSNHGND